MKAHVFVISMLTGIVVTYAVLLLGCLFIDKTLPEPPRVSWRVFYL